MYLPNIFEQQWLYVSVYKCMSEKWAVGRFQVRVSLHPVTGERTAGTVQGVLKNEDFAFFNGHWEELCLFWKHGKYEHGETSNLKSKLVLLSSGYRPKIIFLLPVLL